MARRLRIATPKTAGRRPSQVAPQISGRRTRVEAWPRAAGLLLLKLLLQRWRGRATGQGMHNPALSVEELVVRAEARVHDAVQGGPEPVVDPEEEVVAVAGRELALASENLVVAQRALRDEQLVPDPRVVPVEVERKSPEDPPLRVAADLGVVFARVMEILVEAYVQPDVSPR